MEKRSLLDALGDSEETAEADKQSHLKYSSNSSSEGTFLESLEITMEYRENLEREIETLGDTSIYRQAGETCDIEKGKQRSVLDNLDHSEKTVETKRQTSSYCCSENTDLESHEVTWEYLENLEREINMLGDPNVSLQTYHSCYIENKNHGTPLVDTGDHTYRAKIPVTKDHTQLKRKSTATSDTVYPKSRRLPSVYNHDEHGKTKLKVPKKKGHNKGIPNRTACILNGKSKKTWSPRHEKQGAVSCTADEKAQSKNGQNNVKVHSPLSLDNEESVHLGHGHIQEPIKDLREKLNHKRVVNQIRASTVEKELPCTNMHTCNYKNDNTKIIVPTDDTNDKLIHKETVSLVARKTNGQCSQSIEKLSDKVDDACIKVASNVKHSSPITETAISLGCEETTKDFTQNVVKQGDKDDSACVNMTEITQIDTKSKHKVILTGRIIKDLRPNTAKHSGKVDTACIKVTTEVTQSNQLSKATVSLASEKTATDLTPKMAKHSAECIKKIVPNETQSQRIPETTVSLDDENPTKDLQPKRARLSDKVENTCVNAITVTESNQKPRTAGEKTSKDLTPNTDIHKHSNNIDNACSRSTSEVAKRNSNPKAMVSLAGWLNKSGPVLPSVAKLNLCNKQDKLPDNMLTNDIHDQLVPKGDVRVVGQRTTGDLSQRIADHFDQVNKLKAMLSAKDAKTQSSAQKNP